VVDNAPFQDINGGLHYLRGIHGRVPVVSEEQKFENPKHVEKAEEARDIQHGHRKHICVDDHAYRYHHGVVLGNGELRPYVHTLVLWLKDLSGLLLLAGTLSIKASFHELQQHVCNIAERYESHDKCREQDGRPYFLVPVLVRVCVFSREYLQYASKFFRVFEADDFVIFGARH